MRAGRAGFWIGLMLYGAAAQAQTADTPQALDKNALAFKAAREGKRSPLPAPDFIKAVNDAAFTPDMKIGTDQNAFILKLQVFLDRAHAGAGVIDGFDGGNVRKAVRAYREMNGLPAGEAVDAALWEKISPNQEPPLTTYTVTDKDAAGPFVPDLPTDYGDLAKLERSAYRNAAEMFAERFHMDQDVLEQLNPEAAFGTPGTVITVVKTGERLKTQVVRLVADKTRKDLFGYDDQGKLVVAYPATIGSAQTPSPTGEHVVQAIAVNADYTYRPDVNFQQGKNDRNLRIPPGPNNPIGTTWIGLDKPTYGIHGTPEPSKIDKAGSHGCVRLTNWNVEELARLVKKGVTVSFVE